MPVFSESEKLINESAVSERHSRIYLHNEVTLNFISLYVS